MKTLLTIQLMVMGCLLGTGYALFLEVPSADYPPSNARLNWPIPIS